MVRQVGHDVLEHLRAGALLHPGKLRCRVGGPLAVDDLRQQPLPVGTCVWMSLLVVITISRSSHLPKHRALLEHRLLPEVRFVSTNFVSRDDRNLVTRRFPLDAGRYADLGRMRKDILLKYSILRK